MQFKDELYKAGIPPIPYTLLIAQFDVSRTQGD